MISSLDTYIQEKIAESKNEDLTMSYDAYEKWFENLIRSTARETLEAVLPEKSPRSSKRTELAEHHFKLGYEECRAAIFEAAKEKGIIN